MRWPDNAPLTIDRIDKVTAVALYENKPAPLMKNGALELDGKPVEEPPYITVDLQGGSRIYLDGRLQIFLRPKDVETTEPLPLISFLKEKGVAVDGVKAADLVKDDVLLKRIADPGSIRFTEPGGNGGALVVDGQPIGAVLLYQATAPLDWAKR